MGVGQAVGVARAAQGGRAGFEERLATMSGAEVAQGQVKFATDLEGGLKAAHLSKWGASIDAQVAIDNKLLAAGQEALPSVHKLQTAAASLAKTMSTLSDNKVFEQITTGIVTLSKGIGDIVEVVNRWSNGIPLP
jgi:hypothetical protein